MAVQQGAAPAAGTVASRVLVVESDAQTAAMAGRWLARAGFTVEVVTSVAGAMMWLGESWADLVVLDPRLPGDDGLALQRLRACSDIPVPVVMVSPRGDDHERTWGLKLGADDFVPNPLSPEELVERVRSVLRRARPTAAVTAPARADDPLAFDVDGRRVCVLGRWVALTAIEFRLLAFLAGHPQAYAREVLLERVWGYTVGNLSTVTVHVRRLREKIEPDPAHPVFLLTVWGVGYRLDRSGGGVGAPHL